MESDDVVDVMEQLEGAHVIWFAHGYDEEDRGALTEAIGELLGVAGEDVEEIRFGTGYTFDADGRWSQCLLVQHDGGESWAALPWSRLFTVEETSDPFHVMRSLNRNDPDEHWIEKQSALGSAAPMFEGSDSNVPYEQYWMDGAEMIEADDEEPVDASVARADHLDWEWRRETAADREEE